MTDKIYPCPICNNANGVVVHISGGNEELWGCGECGNVWQNEEELISAMKKANQTELEHLLPQHKQDNSNIDRLKNLHDEEIRPLIPELLSWLADCNWPVASDVLGVLKSRESLVFPHIAGILTGSDVEWKCWIMQLLIPSFSPEHKEELRGEIEKLMSLTSLDEDTQWVVEIATYCYNKCFT